MDICCNVVQMFYPFYRFLFCLIVGILCAKFLEIPLFFAIATGAFSLIVIILIRYLSKSLIWKKYIFGLLSLIFFTSLGSAVFSYSQSLPSNHFTKQDIIGKDYLIQLRLTDRLATNEFNNRFYADVLSIDNKDASGKILVLFKRSDSIEYGIGNQLLIYDDINYPSNARNPGDFNYSDYLKSIDVYGQIYVDKASIFKNQRATEFDRNAIETYKSNILSKLKTSGLSIKPRSLIEALVLGQRQNVDPEITKSFRDAGVIHILALSGLHVGIILLILRFITKPLLLIHQGRWLQSGSIIIFLWSFAALTGMSPSILRAVTMFSFVAVGMNIKRKASTFHSLTLSAFFLLLYDPRFLFQVGFQLSYTAVYAIVLIQPIIQSLWRQRLPVKNTLWSVFTVTIAAQIGVAPLSIFYFNQLPGLFLVGNMILLPILPLIIGLSMLLILLLTFNFPVDYLVDILNFILDRIIQLVSRISSYDNFIFSDLYLELYEVILIYFILFSAALFYRPFTTRSKKEKVKRLQPNGMFHVSLASILVLVSAGLILNQLNNKEVVMVLHQSRGSAVGISNGTEAILLTDLTQVDSNRKKISLNRLKNVEPFRNKSLKADTLRNSLSFKGLNIVRVDSTGTWTINHRDHNPVILLSHSPKINLERLIRELNPDAIISDGSNYRGLTKLWSKTCGTYDIPFYNTYDTGAVNLLDI